MRDITSSLARYREVARHLWNTALQGPSWDSYDHFERICDELFLAMVVLPLGIPTERGVGVPSHSGLSVELVVVPSSDRGVPVHINRGAPRTPYWDSPVSMIGANDAELAFIGFFDWDQLAMRDFAFLEVRIKAFDARPDLVGRAALVPFEYARVFAPHLDEPAGEARPES